ncbi:MAG: VOC family protein [Alphaproteobacteria bacterium]|nr:VOC family protein [Alphaproteobacteria bacterium]|tara:strand:- start:3686 stop:4177 length:492 start_codon:yes stop_codon:yes gene_type:complete
MTSFVKKTKRAAGVAMLLAGVAFAAAPAMSEEAAPQADAINKIAAAVLNVSDLDAATEFYTSVVGLEVERSASDEGYVENILVTPDTTGTKLVLFQSMGEAPEVISGRVVFYTDDAESVVSAIKARGLAVEREAAPIAPGLPIIVGIAKDADGNYLEFIQRDK